MLEVKGDGLSSVSNVMVESLYKILQLSQRSLQVEKVRVTLLRVTQHLLHTYTHTKNIVFTVSFSLFITA